MLKKDCAQTYTQFKSGVLGFLTQANWVQGEARERGIQVSGAEVQSELNRFKRVEFPGQQFNQYLASFGGSVADLSLQVKLHLLASKIEQKIRKDAGVAMLPNKHASDAEIASYYSRFKQGLDAQPERRDIRIILTKTAGQAEAAKSELQSGKSFASVAAKYSIDPESKALGGLVREVSREKPLPGSLGGSGSLSGGYMPLGEEVLTAKPHELVGPKAGGSGYVLFEVAMIYPPVKATLSQFKQKIISEGQQQAQEQFLQSYWQKWKARTDCPAGYVVEYCKQYKGARPASIQFPPTVYDVEGHLKGLGTLEREQRSRQPSK